MKGCLLRSGSDGWAEMRGQDASVVAARDGKSEETKFPARDIGRAINLA